VRIDEVAELLELTELLDRRARFMSGGEKRRLHTALALVHRPRLLLLDEPTTGVDVQSRARLIAAVTAMADGGVALCYTTHYLAEVEAMPARVAIIDSGRIIVRGTVPELVERHAATVVEFDFASAPPPLPDLPEAVVDGNLVRVPTQRPTTTIADVMRLTESTGATLASVELVRPSLETVFLGVTGRRYGAEANGSQADSDSSEAAHA
jgi:ABC-2 type transport system ATP-binding protein